MYQLWRGAATLHLLVSYTGNTWSKNRTLCRCEVLCSWTVFPSMQTFHLLEDIFQAKEETVVDNRFVNVYPVSDTLNKHDYCHIIHLFLEKTCIIFEESLVPVFIE